MEGSDELTAVRPNPDTGEPGTGIVTVVTPRAYDEGGDRGGGLNSEIFVSFPLIEGRDTTTSSYFGWALVAASTKYLLRYFLFCCTVSTDV